MKRLISLALSLLLLLPSALPAGAVSLNNPEVFLKQEGARTCTLCSTTMLLRRRAILDLDARWQDITESALSGTAWVKGSGLLPRFSFRGYQVETVPRRSNWGGGTLEGKKAYLIDYLSSHPEGLVVFNWDKPHAVLLTDYDADTDTFFCAETVSYMPYGRIPLAECTIPGDTQDEVLEHIYQLWVVAGGVSKNAGTFPAEELSLEVPPYYPPGTFLDLPDTHWAASYAHDAYDLGLMKGTSNTTFSPAMAFSAVQTITLAARLHQSWSFGVLPAAVETDSWYGPYLAYARAQGILTGEMDWEAPVDRETFLHLLCAALPADLLPQPEEEELPFLDAQDLAYPEEIALLYQQGVVTGKQEDEGLVLRPWGEVSRGEAAALSVRLLRFLFRLSQDQG